MSELAAKLARRRALNGEGDAEPCTYESSSMRNSFKMEKEKKDNDTTRRRSDSCRQGDGRGQEKESTQEKGEQERIAKEKAEEERMMRVKAEREAAEKVSREKVEREKVEQERIAREKAEQERIIREKAEKEAADRVKKEKEEQERVAREKEEQEAAEKEAKAKAEQDRIAKMKIEREAAEKLAKEEAQREREAQERAAREREAAEKAAREREEQEAAELALQEKAEQEAAEKAARMLAQQEALEGKQQREKELLNKKNESAVPTDSKDDDELKDLENFFDNMDDDAYLIEGLDLGSPQLSREPSKSVTGTKNMFFAEDSIDLVEEDDVNSAHSLTIKNSKLKAEEASLTNELAAKDAHIRKIKIQIDSFSKRIKEEKVDSSNDDAANPSGSRLSFRKKVSANLFADDDEGSGFGRVASFNDLAKSNAMLESQIEKLKLEVEKKREIILSTQKELDNLRKTHLQNEKESDAFTPRGSTSARVMLQSNLDYMGLDSNLADLMDVLHEEDSSSEDGSKTNDVDDDNIFGYSDDKKIDSSINSLDGLLNPLATTTESQVNLDSNFWASQDDFQKRMRSLDDPVDHSDQEATEQAALLARQKMDTHGLFGGADVDLDIVGSNDSKNKNKAMFKDDHHAGEKEKARKSKKENDQKGGYHYDEFVRKLMHPDNVSIANAIKKFIQSVLGPNGDCSHPRRGVKLDYEFHGLSRLSARCDDFMCAIIDHLREAPGWSGDTDERYISARDCLEKLIMTKIHEYAFESVESPADDDELLTRMKLLSFVPASALDIKPELVNDLVFALARDELSKINSYTLPADKIACITRCAAVIFRSLNLARAKTEASLSDNQSALGADDFLPMFILVVLRSQVPKLHSNCEYIQSFHSPDQMRSRAGYCFVNLRSAMEFILSATSDDLSMDAAEFDSKLKEATEKLASAE